MLLAKALTVVDLAKVPNPKNGQASVINDVLKVLLALLTQPLARSYFCDFEPSIALIGLMRNKERVDGSPAEQSEFVHNGIRILRLLAESAVGSF